MRRLRFGLLGFSQGFYATTYTKSLLNRPDVEIVACCDLGMPADYVRECAFVSAEQFAAEVGAELLHDVDAFFDRSLDAVMVTTEVWEHRRYTLLALERGCHVFVGKPLSFMAQDVLDVMDAAALANRVVLPGQPLRYESGLKEAAARIHRGEIGKPLYVRLLLNHEAMVHQAWERDPARSGGPLGTFGVYLFDIVRWLTRSEFAEVFAYGDNFVFPQINSEDLIHVNARLSCGALAALTLVSTITWPYPFVAVEVVGTDGVLRTNYDNYRTVVQSARGAALGEARYCPMGAFEIGHFVDCCLGREAPRVTLYDALQAARGIEATRASLSTGRPVAVGGRL